MRQGWVVMIQDKQTKEPKYRIVWGSQDEAEAQSEIWWEKLRDKGFGARFTVQTTFPYAEYERGDFIEIRCEAPSIESLQQISEELDAYAIQDPDVEGGFIVEVYKDEMRELMERLHAHPLVNGVRIIPDLSTLIDEAVQIKLRLDGQLAETG